MAEPRRREKKSFSLSLTKLIVRRVLLAEATMFVFHSELFENCFKTASTLRVRQKRTAQEIQFAELRKPNQKELPHAAPDSQAENVSPEDVEWVGGGGSRHKSFS